MMGGPSSAQTPQAPAQAQAQAQAQVQPSVGAGAKPQLQSYPAYEKNGLKITLTPKISPTQPGVVQILARFTATEGIQGVNFQVAVPKVSAQCSGQQRRQ
jgi:AP-1 complex subunit gamma-1